METRGLPVLPLVPQTPEPQTFLSHPVTGPQGPDSLIPGPPRSQGWSHFTLYWCPTPSRPVSSVRSSRPVSTTSFAVSGPCLRTEVVGRSGSTSGEPFTLRRPLGPRPRSSTVGEWVTGSPGVEEGVVPLEDNVPDRDEEPEDVCRPLLPFPSGDRRHARDRGSRTGIGVASRTSTRRTWTQSARTSGTNRA